MNPKKLLLFIILIAAIMVFFYFDLGRFLDLAYLKARQAEMDAYFQGNPFQTSFIFFMIYIVVTALSLPGAGILTLTAGAIFGLLWGTVLSSFASSIGGTLAFLASRYLFREMVQERFADKLVKINEGVHKDGAFYLFTMRLIPIFPFFVINVVMGLLPMRAMTFYFVSQAGMILPTIVFVNAGVQIAKIQTAGDILSLPVIASFALLGLFPLAAKKLIEHIKSRRRHSIEPDREGNNGL